MKAVATISRRRVRYSPVVMTKESQLYFGENYKTREEAQKRAEALAVEHKGSPAVWSHRF